MSIFSRVTQEQQQWAAVAPLVALLCLISIEETLAITATIHTHTTQVSEANMKAKHCLKEFMFCQVICAFALFYLSLKQLTVRDLLQKSVEFCSLCTATPPFWNVFLNIRWIVDDVRGSGFGRGCWDVSGFTVQSFTRWTLKMGNVFQKLTINRAPLTAFVYFCAGN